MRSLWITVLMLASILSFSCAVNRSDVTEDWAYSRIPAINEEWHQFAGRLSLVIGELRRHEFLILSERKRNVYIQLASGGSLGMQAEAVSEQFYPGVGENEKKMLRILGWKPPTYFLGSATKGPRGGGSCNYYINAGNVAPSKLADFITRTFCDVYCTRTPAALQYRAFGDTPNGTYELRFPELGLRLEKHSQIISAVVKSKATH